MYLQSENRVFNYFEAFSSTSTFVSSPSKSALSSFDRNKTPYYFEAFSSTSTFVSSPSKSALSNSTVSDSA